MAGTTFRDDIDLEAPTPTKLTSWVSDWGSFVIDGIELVGDIALFTYQMLYWMFTRLPRRGTTLINFYQVGVLSLPVVAITGTFIGMVLAVQSHHQFHLIGLESRLGVVIKHILGSRAWARAGCNHVSGTCGQRYGCCAGYDACY